MQSDKKEALKLSCKSMEVTLFLLTNRITSFALVLGNLSRKYLKYPRSLPISFKASFYLLNYGINNKHGYLAIGYRTDASKCRNHVLCTSSTVARAWNLCRRSIKLRRSLGKIGARLDGHTATANDQHLRPCSRLQSKHQGYGQQHTWSYIGQI